MNRVVTIRLPALLPTREEGPILEVSPFPTAAASEVADETLMARVCEEDKEALAFLFRRYARHVRGVAYRILRDASEADDLLQDIFLLIHSKCRSFDSSKGPVRFWILQMTYRRAISRRRYLNSRHFYTRIDLEDVANQLCGEDASSRKYEDSIEGTLGNGALDEMFEKLSEDQRQTFRLFFFEGHSLDEIASRLGQSRGNVKHHYFRGLEKLRKHFFGSSPRGD